MFSLQLSLKSLDRVWKRDDSRSKMENRGKEGFIVEDEETSKYFYEIPRMYQSMCLLISVLLAIAFYTKKLKVCLIQGAQDQNLPKYCYTLVSPDFIFGPMLL